MGKDQTNISKNKKGLVSKSFKGTVSRDFRLQVFFMNQFPPSP
jgi:hypothetical protein